MLSAPLALAATIALVPTAVIGPADAAPDPSWEEDESSEDSADEDAEAETDDEVDSEATPSPPPPEAAGATPPVEVRYEMRPVPIPKRKGLGLLISSGVLGAIGWGVMGWRMSLIKNGCSPDELDNNPDVTVEEAGDAFDTALGCAGAEVISTFGWALQATAGAVNFGIAPAGGARLGKYEAAKFVEEGGPKRNHKLFIGLGASLLAAGLIGRLTVAAVRWDGLINFERSALGRCIPDDAALVREVFDCYALRRQLHFFGQQFTSSAISAGGGMLAYGLANRKWKKKFYEDYKKEKITFNVAPQLSFGYTGIAAEVGF